MKKSLNIADKHGKTTAQIVYVGNSGSSIQNQSLDDKLRTRYFDFELSEEEMKQINALTLKRSE